jgi:hypothetical protein
MRDVRRICEERNPEVYLQLRSARDLMRTFYMGIVECFVYLVSHGMSYNLGTHIFLDLPSLALLYDTNMHSLNS